MNILVVSTSLNRNSRSQKFAKYCEAELRQRGCSVKFIDLRSVEFPMCDGETTWDHPVVQSFQRQVRAADAVVIAAPVYNWSVAASSKHFVECMGHAFDGKVIALLCAAGGPRALLAPMSLASSMIVDFQAIIVPKIVVVGREPDSEKELSPETERRIWEMNELMLRISSALKSELHDRGPCEESAWN